MNDLTHLAQATLARIERDSDWNEYDRQMSRDSDDDAAYVLLGLVSIVCICAVGLGALVWWIL